MGPTTDAPPAADTAQIDNSRWDSTASHPAPRDRQPSPASGTSRTALSVGLGCRSSSVCRSFTAAPWTKKNSTLWRLPLEPASAHRQTMTTDITVRMLELLNAATEYIRCDLAFQFDSHRIRWVRIWADRGDDYRHFSILDLHGIVMIRGSSGLPATVNAALYPQMVQVTM